MLKNDGIAFGGDNYKDCGPWVNECFWPPILIHFTANEMGAILVTVQGISRTRMEVFRFALGARDAIFLLIRNLNERALP